MMRGSRSFYLVAGIMFLALLATALVFVLVLRPANDEYNNTIPAVMGVLTLCGTGITALVNMLDLSKKHRENLAHIETLEKGLAAGDEGSP